MQKLWQLIAMSANDAARAEYLMSVSALDRKRALTFEVYEPRWEAWKPESERVAA